MTGLVEVVSCAMLCLGCGAEMRLVEAVEDSTMLVPGYEHQTWQCLGCSDVEQRLTFTGKKRRTHKAPLGPVHMGSVEPAQTAAVEPVQTEPVETAPIVPIQVTQITEVDPSQTTSVVEATLSVEATQEPEPARAIPPQMSATTLQTSVLPKSVDERLSYLTRRVTEFREAAALDKRRAQFDRDWDNPRSVNSASSSPKSSSHKHRDDRSSSPAAPVAAQAPTPHDEPTAPDRASRWSFRQLLRYGPGKG
jgi:hypothetical protein